MTTPIQARRKALNMTQEDLARRAGMSITVLQKYERGACRIATARVYNVVALARALGATVEELYAEEAAALSKDEQPSLAD